MFDKIKEYKEKKRNRMSIESFLLDKNFIIHDVKHKGKTVIYNKNMQTLTIHNKGEKNERVIFDIGGDIVFDVGFIPSNITLFECLLKEAIKNKT